MTIHIGEDKVSGVYLGALEVNKIYKDQDIIYQKNQLQKRTLIFEEVGTSSDAYGEFIKSDHINIGRTSIGTNVSSDWSSIQYYAPNCYLQGDYEINFTLVEFQDSSAQFARFKTDSDELVWRLDYDEDESNAFKLTDGQRTFSWASAQHQNLHFKITRIGNTLKVYVNNDLKVTVQGTSTVDGIFAFPALFLSGGYWFSNLSIYRLRVPVTRLPGGYQELSHVECTGNQWLNTGVTAWENEELKILARLRQTLASEDNQVLIDPNDSAYNLKVSHTDNKLYLYNEVYNNISMGDVLNVDLTHLGKRQGSTTTCIVNGQSKTVSFPYVTPDVTRIGSSSQYGSDKSYLKIYAVAIWVNNTKVRDFVPAKKKVDGSVGLYDMVNDTFYTSEGSGAFVAGYEIDPIKSNLFIDDCLNTSYNENYTTIGTCNVNRTSAGMDFTSSLNKEGYLKANQLITGDFDITFKVIASDSDVTIDAAAALLNNEDVNRISFTREVSQGFKFNWLYEDGGMIRSDTSSNSNQMWKITRRSNVIRLTAIEPGTGQTIGSLVSTMGIHKNAYFAWPALANKDTHFKVKDLRINYMGDPGELPFPSYITEVPLSKLLEHNTSTLV